MGATGDATANNVGNFVAEATTKNEGTAVLNSATASSIINMTDSTSGGYTLTGAGGVDQLTGGTGDDIISGASSDDTLVGGGGNDNITGGAGDDSLTGGDGNDTFNIDLVLMD